MKKFVLALSLAAAALTGCAQLKDAYIQASAGASAVDASNPHPKSSSNIAGN